jgi:hypothetical protein
MSTAPAAMKTSADAAGHGSARGIWSSPCELVAAAGFLLRPLSGRATFVAIPERLRTIF